MRRKTAVTNITDISRIAGCSIATVSRVLNSSGAVSAEKRDAILDAIRETDYYTNRPRKGGRRGRTPRALESTIEIIQHRHSVIERINVSEGKLDVGPLISPWSSASQTATFRSDNSFHRGIVDGALDELVHWNARSLLRSNSNLLDPALLSEINNMRNAGVLVVGEYSPDLSKFVRNCAHPVVLADIISTDDIDVVTTDNMHGITLAFKHLYELGHRKIGFVGALDDEAGRVDERYVAYQLNMMDKGLAPRRDWVFYGADHITEVTEGVTKILKLADKPTALVCKNDCYALGVLRAASRLGMPIPGKLSVVGFDDIESSSLVTPPLTTIRVPVMELGRRSVRELMIRMKRGSPIEDHGCCIRVRPELVVRDSTAAV